MEDILIVVGVVAVLLYFGHQSAATTVAVVPPQPPVPTATAIPTMGASVSGGYQLPPATTQLAVPNVATFLLNPQSAGAVSAKKLASTVAPPPSAVPPPAFSGGIAGTVGSGGVPMGSVLRPGVSSGTGTTSLNPFGPYLQ